MIFIVILSLKPATLGKRDDVHASHDQVVQQADVYKAECLYKALRDRPVCLAGGGVTGRMVVGDNHRRRIEVQGAFDSLAGMDFGTADGTGEEDFMSNKAMLIVKIQHHKHFTL
jgi:hypothetical protein